MIYLYNIIIIGALGLGVGSFLNVVLFRMTTEKKFWNGRSECMYCQHTLQWYELIPLLSYIYQGGKCCQCKHKLSLQYPLVELFTGVVFVGIWYIYVPNILILATIDTVTMLKIIILWITTTQLMIIFVYDLLYQLIPVIQLRALQIAGLAWAGLMSYEQGIIFDSWITAFITSGTILGLYVMTRKQGMGWGDIELFFALGLFIPAIWGIWFFFGAFIIGSVWGLCMMIIYKNNSLKQKIAFGPSIIVSFILTFLISYTDLALYGEIWYYTYINKI
jgi:prepilin signal peptidase PulO-like enzyme (type II secretory pathway)